MAIATFAAGCFWGVEHAFQQLTGVTKTEVGYMGGHLPKPTYHQVCGGKTGHAEVVQIEFDPDLCSYQALLQEFFDCHDPTMLNRQGVDIGSQYRSSIFYHSEEQKILATAIKRQLDDFKRFSNPIVTDITSSKIFYPAEEYHQDYITKNGGGHCKTD